MLTGRKRKQRDRLNEKTDLRIGCDSRFTEPEGSGIDTYMGYEKSNFILLKLYIIKTSLKPTLKKGGFIYTFNHDRLYQTNQEFQQI